MEEKNIYLVDRDTWEVKAVVDFEWVEENIDELEAGALDHMGLRIELEDTSKLKKWNSHGIIA